MDYELKIPIIKINPEINNYIELLLTFIFHNLFYITTLLILL
jgi:hypothetical protein